MSLSFDEDLRKAGVQDRDNKAKHKKNKRKNVKEPSKLQENDRKKSKKELMAKTREEVVILFRTLIAHCCLFFVHYSCGINVLNPPHRFLLIISLFLLPRMLWKR